ncbi:MAG TPA: zinc ribbon domain-containing protein, partial [Blastocatellia bacterium]|nr:zinc ribbon domain-containing protein [Blastocatellia bacterium]
SAKTAPQSRVIVAPEAIAVTPHVVDSPGSVILRAEDLLPEDECEPEPVVRRVEDQGRKVEMNDNFRTSGPLTGEMPSVTQSPPAPLACPSCGSQSDAQDLFCIECGAFLNESDTLEVEVQGIPACVDCGAAVEPGEIFCPSCGCALPG